MARKPPETALYVRLPANAGARLHRAAEALGVAKKDLVAGLVTKYVDPDSQHGLAALDTLSQRRRAGTAILAGESGPKLGSHSFQPYDPPEVLNLEQAGELLQVEAGLVARLAEDGELPGRKLGDDWRFSRTALLTWLAAGEQS